MSKLPQSALRHRPGALDAVAVWRRRGGASDDALRAAAGALLELARPAGSHLLVALAPSLVASVNPSNAPRKNIVGKRKDIPPVNDGWTPAASGPFAPPTQAHVWTQVAAPDRSSLLELLRRVSLTLGSLANLDEELLGGKIGDGREPFGFHDSIAAPTPAERAALVGSDGATRILYLRFEQNLDRFAAQSDLARQAVIGQLSDGKPSPAKDSHRARFAATAGVVRRGFAYRQSGAEGLAFVAAAAELEPLQRAWTHFEGDPLQRFVTPLSSGLYVAPPDAAWLRARSEKDAR